MPSSVNKNRIFSPTGELTQLDRVSLPMRKTNQEILLTNLDMPCHLCLSFGTYSHYDHRLLYQRLPRLRCQKKTSALHHFKQNGSIFVSDCHELQEKLNAAIRKNQQAPPLAAEMKWHLNPSLVPRSDGTWERLIQTPKKTLLLILGSRNLTLELFHTLLAETELMLNSRPLILTTRNLDTQPFASPQTLCKFSTWGFPRFKKSAHTDVLERN